jgi:hypothetical protein
VLIWARTGSLTQSLSAADLGYGLCPVFSFVFQTKFKNICERNKNNFFQGWVAKSVVRQLATAALWVRIQTSLKKSKKKTKKNHKWAT